jgi:hypothetical protein
MYLEEIGAGAQDPGESILAKRRKNVPAGD